MDYHEFMNNQKNAIEYQEIMVGVRNTVRICEGGVWRVFELSKDENGLYMIGDCLRCFGNVKNKDWR